MGLVKGLIQDTPEWHAFRIEGVGASEVPAVLGVCIYNTVHGIWSVKTKRSKGFEGNSFTEHGKETEAKARARYELTAMEDVAPACAIHPTYSICRASLDGISANGKLILEIKCPKGRSTIDTAMAPVPGGLLPLEAAKLRVPAQYWPQIQYQLAVTGADLCHFYVFHEESGDTALVPVPPDVDYQGEIIVKVLDFWAKYVITDIPPPLTDRDVKIVESPDIADICQQILARKDQLAKADLDKLKARAVALAGHPKMKCGNVQISTVNRNGKFSFHKLTVSTPGQTSEA